MGHDEENAFELLDEPEPRSGKRPAWLRVELWIGVLLLLSVAGGGTWDWWQQQSALAAYRAGDQAAAARDWDAARVAFLAAADYNHAGARAAAATQQIHDRDAAYAAANAERDTGQWAAALRDFRHVQEIEPGFRDSARLAQLAEQQVYRLALTGTVARRLAAHPPGLYLYWADRWNYLPGSDAASQVRSSSASPCLVYDTPVAPPPDGAPAHPPASVAENPPAGPPAAVSGRGLMVAQYGGPRLTARALAFDPTAFSWFACDASGVIGARDTANSGGNLDLRLALVHRIPVSAPSYQDSNSTVATLLPLPGPAWAILAAASRKRLVVGDYTHVLGAMLQTVLYVRDPPGPLVRVAARPAIVQAAWLSPDGHYLLADELVPPGAGREEHRLVLLTTDGSRAPEVLMTAKLGDSLVLAGVWFDAAFIDSGAHAGQLVIERKTYPNGELRLVDPHDPRSTLWSSDQINYVDPLQVWSLDGGLLFPVRSSATDALAALYMDARGQTTRLALPAPGGDSLAVVKESSGRLVYVYLNPTNSAAGPAATIRSIPWPPEAGADTTSMLLFSASTPLDAEAKNPEQYSAAGRQWSLGPGLLAYTQDGQLAAKTYDGTITVPLEGSVSRLYPSGP